MPEPLYKAWADAYHKENPEVTIRYLGVGTSESAHDVLRGSGDFGGGDTPIPESELATSKTQILQLPSVFIGIVVVYSLPQTPGELKPTGRVLADIYLGKVKDWRDPAIAKLNPELKLPALPIQVVHRNEGKGSNYIFSDFLTKVSPEFSLALEEAIRRSGLWGKVFKDRKIFRKK
jgi:phosphate transport system substrate-binding protein